jgi:hypothetical protein
LGRKARVEGGVGWGGRVVWKVEEDGRKGSVERGVDWGGRVRCKVE